MLADSILFAVVERSYMYIVLYLLTEPDETSKVLSLLPGVE